MTDVVSTHTPRHRVHATQTAVIYGVLCARICRISNDVICLCWLFYVMAVDEQAPRESTVHAHIFLKVPLSYSLLRQLKQFSTRVVWLLCGQAQTAIYPLHIPILTKLTRHWWRYKQLLNNGVTSVAQLSSTLSHLFTHNERQFVY